MLYSCLLNIAHVGSQTALQRRSVGVQTNGYRRDPRSCLSLLRQSESSTYNDGLLMYNILYNDLMVMGKAAYDNKDLFVLRD